MGSTLKGKNLLLLEQILSFNSRPLRERLYFEGKQTGCHKICLFFSLPRGFRWLCMGHLSLEGLIIHWISLLMAVAAVS